MPNVIEEIENFKSQGLTEEQIIQELIKKYPEKGKIFSQALQRTNAKKVIEEILKQNQPEPAPAPEQSLEQTIEEAKERIEKLKEIKKEEPQFVPQENEPTDQKLDEFLKRKISSEEAEAPQQPLSEGVTAEDQIPLPEKKSPIARFLLRLAIVSGVIIALGGIGLFWYWYFLIQPQGACKTDADCVQGYSCQDKNCVQVLLSCSSDKDCSSGYYCQDKACKKRSTSLIFSDPVFYVDETSIAEIDSQDKALIVQKFQEWVNANEYKRIALADKSKAQEITLKDFFNIMQISFPEEFFSKLGENFTLFAYSQIEGKRMGFAAGIKDIQGLQALLTSKENSWEVDFAPIYDIVKGDAVLAKNKIFRDAKLVKSYTGPSFRYKILASNDIGAYYAIYKDQYFIFSTSWKSMEGALKRLENPLTE